MTEQRVALVTGASSGIGATTAKHLAKAGFLVYAAARRTDRLEELRRARIRPLSMDVTDDDSMTAGVRQVLARAPARSTHWSTTPATAAMAPVEDVPLDEARRQFDVNLFGMARLTQLVLPGMRERGSGRVVNISSMGGRFAAPFGGWYHTRRFAVEGFSDSLRQELAPFGVQVVVIEPGGIRTEWGGVAADSALQQSGEGAYGPRVQRVVSALSGSDRLAPSRRWWPGRSPGRSPRNAHAPATRSGPGRSR